MPNDKPTAYPIDVQDEAPPAPVKRSRGGAKGLRITDVAAVAGVSPITVSRVFNNPESVAPETLERVRQVVQKLGYVPNRLAGGLSSSKSRLIAAIVPTIAHSLFSETIQVFSETMSKAGYQVLLALSGFALFFLVDDRWQHGTALAHDILGLAVTISGVQHGLFARRGDLRRDG